MTKEFVSASRRAAALGRKHGFEIHNVNLMQQFVQPFNRSRPLLSKEATTKKKAKIFLSKASKSLFEAAAENKHISDPYVSVGLSPSKVTQIAQFMDPPVFFLVR